MDECYGKSLLWRNGCGVFPDLHYGILSAPASFLWCVLSGTEAKYFIVHRDVCNDGVYDVAGGDGKISVYSFGGRHRNSLLYVGES